MQMSKGREIKIPLILLPPRDNSMKVFIYIFQTFFFMHSCVLACLVLYIVCAMLLLFFFFLASLWDVSSPSRN